MAVRIAFGFGHRTVSMADGSFIIKGLSNTGNIVCTAEATLEAQAAPSQLSEEERDKMFILESIKLVNLESVENQL